MGAFHCPHAATGSKSFEQITQSPTSMLRAIQYPNTGEDCGVMRLPPRHQRARRCNWPSLRLSQTLQVFGSTHVARDNVARRVEAGRVGREDGVNTHSPPPSAVHPFDDDGIAVSQRFDWSGVVSERSIISRWQTTVGLAKFPASFIFHCSRCCEGQIHHHFISGNTGMVRQRTVPPRELGSRGCDERNTNHCDAPGQVSMWRVGH